MIFTVLIWCSNFRKNMFIVNKISHNTNDCSSTYTRLFPSWLFQSVYSWLLKVDLKSTVPSWLSSRFSTVDYESTISWLFADYKLYNISYCQNCKMIEDFSSQFNPFCENLSLFSKHATYTGYLEIIAKYFMGR